MKKILVLSLALCMIFSMASCSVESDAEIELESVEEVENESLEESVSTDVVVAETDELLFVVKGTEVDEFFDTWGVKVLIENKTDKALTVAWDDVSVNGYMIDPFWATEVAAGKKENTVITFWSSDFEENNITVVEDIEFVLRGYCLDEETWDTTNYIEETFTVTFN